MPSSLTAVVERLAVPLKSPEKVIVEAIQFKQTYTLPFKKIECIIDQCNNTDTSQRHHY